MYPLFPIDMQFLKHLQGNLVDKNGLNKFNKSSKNAFENNKEALFNCSCRKSKFSCIGCINAANISNAAWVTPLSSLFNALTTLTPTFSRNFGNVVNASKPAFEATNLRNAWKKPSKMARDYNKISSSNSYFHSRQL